MVDQAIISCVASDHSSKTLVKNPSISPKNRTHSSSSINNGLAWFDIQIAHIHRIPLVDDGPRPAPPAYSFPSSHPPPLILHQSKVLNYES